MPGRTRGGIAHVSILEMHSCVEEFHAIVMYQLVSIVSGSLCRWSDRIEGMSLILCTACEVKFTVKS